MEKQTFIERINNDIEEFGFTGEPWIFDENDKVIVVGRFDSKFKFSHDCANQKFYESALKILRGSGKEDEITIIVHESLVESIKCDPEMVVAVAGKYKTKNICGDDNKQHLRMYIQAGMVVQYDSQKSISKDRRTTNIIYLDGFVCKRPTLRYTPLGKTISDVTVAVNMRFGKSAYVPCISWGNIANFTKKLKVGDHIQLYGRTQSRIYVKDGEFKKANEISIFQLQKVEE